MATLEEMRDRVRDFVRDTNTDIERRKVSDAELDVYLEEALAEYSVRFPMRSTDDSSPAASIAPPSDIVPGDTSLYQVEVNGVLWKQSTPAAGDTLPTSGTYWYWRGGQIALSSTPSTTVTLWYGATWPFPAQDTDPFTIPDNDLELLELYAAIKFHQKLGTVAAKLDRFRERGERDDNPLVMMHEVLRKQYEELVRARSHRGAARIRRHQA